MGTRSSLLLLALPLLVACSGESEPVGTAAEAITVCAAGSTVNGVDISHYDGTIDWATVKSSGISFAFAKATEGTTYTDPTFATNWAGMKSAGVIRSAYHFFHANVDPTMEANYFLSVMGTLEPGDLPPTLDLEVTDSESAATITANTITWLDTVAAATGTKPILYTSPSFVTGSMGSPAGLENHAQLWIANWGVTCPDVPAPFTGWSFWQNSDTGTVSGIPGASAVDLDEYNGDLAALQAITVGGSMSSSSSSSSTSASSSSGGTACTVAGVAGTCIGTSVCAAMTGYHSTAGFCPGPADIECCTPDGGSSSSSSSSSGTTASSSTSSSGGTTTSSSSGATMSSTSSSGSTSGGTGGSSGSSSGGAGGDGAGGGSTGTYHTGLGGNVGVSSGCSAAPRGGDVGTGARALLFVIAGALSARRRRRA